MSQISPRLGLPYIQPSQAQKHVTHNDAIQRLDAMTQLVVEAFGAEMPPITPAEGEAWALGPAPQSAWAGQAGQVAVYSGAGWIFLTPVEGWRAWGKAEAALRVYTGGAWAGQSFETNNLAEVGINASADAVNRLTVASEATLFNNTGAGHQMKINKAADGDTASLLFQSGFTGHAEMGLSGDTAFSVKVSADGAAWVNALRADPTALQIDLPVTGAAVQADGDDVTPGRLMLAEHGVLRSAILGTVSETAGQPTGAVIESGTNGDGAYVRWADGTQLCTSPTLTVDCNQADGALFASASGAWSYPAPFTTVTTGGGSAQDTSLWVAFAPAPLTGGYRARATTARTGDTITLWALGRWF